MGVPAQHFSAENENRVTYWSDSANAGIIGPLAKGGLMSVDKKETRVCRKHSMDIAYRGCSGCPLCAVERDMRRERLRALSKRKTFEASVLTAINALQESLDTLVELDKNNQDERGREDVRITHLLDLVYDKVSEAVSLLREEVK